jgi:two-component system response regulator PilR (NtrC family)
MTPEQKAEEMRKFREQLRASSGKERINIFKAANVINEHEARKMTLQIPKAPPAPATVQPGQPSMTWLDRFITQDPALVEMKEHVKKLAPLQHPVLIHGESGTGKELIARAMHNTRHGKFVAVNCAAISENLIESELFGHAKGSFTGAYTDKIGLLQDARDGTIFLDEIGDLPKAMQPKLLRAIQNKTVRRVGSTQDEEISCRFISATHKHLWTAVNDGEFRMDLYFRLAVFEVEIKPMRERCLEDFILLAKAYGGTEEDAQYLHDNRAQLRGNIRQMQHWFLRKQVLGINSL